MPKTRTREDLGLGRVIIPDYRDQLYPARKVMPPFQMPSEGKKYHNNKGWTGNQGALPQCVGYTFAHFLEDGPITYGGTAPIFPPDKIYRGAQEQDEWPGIDYDGTSGRGAAKFLMEQGIIKSFHHIYTLEEFVQALVEQPVPVGMSWYTDMYEPNASGFINATGTFEGGHEILANGVNFRKRKVRFKNSWGEDWGDKGHFWMTFEMCSQWIFDHGDMMWVIENPEYKVAA